ncbi:hypothetical protein J6590_056765 [Homalodisca vitripennis]|nr:hypothetical protein J6590_056765 [Homalodisca vitripennis]
MFRTRTTTCHSTVHLNTRVDHDANSRTDLGHRHHLISRCNLPCLLSLTLGREGCALQRRGYVIRYTRCMLCEWDLPIRLRGSSTLESWALILKIRSHRFTVTSTVTALVKYTGGTCRAGKWRHDRTSDKRGPVTVTNWVGASEHTLQSTRVADCLPSQRLHLGSGKGRGTVVGGRGGEGRPRFTFNLFTDIVP